MTKLLMTLFGAITVFSLAGCKYNSLPQSGMSTQEGQEVLTTNPGYGSSILMLNDKAVVFYRPELKSSTTRINKVGGAVYKEGDYITIVLPADSVFESNTAEFVKGGEAVLSSCAAIIKSYPDEEVIVTTHTDGHGSDFKQAILSRNQAQATALNLWQDNAMIGKKNQDQFKYAGMSNTQPVANESTVRGQALNRRVQITIYPETAQSEISHLVAGVDISTIKPES
jgi:outer membrane protein OmpA-like peptidoglycan-associated protein